MSTNLKVRILRSASKDGLEFEINNFLENTILDIVDIKYQCTGVGNSIYYSAMIICN